MKEIDFAKQRSAKVMRIPLERMAQILRGECVIKNLPADAECYAAQVCSNDHSLAVRVTSRSYSAIPYGDQLPVITAVFERKQLSRKIA